MLIGKGAEAELHKDKNTVKKIRVKKNYRIKEIDKPLRKTRTRREAKILEKLPQQIPAPELLEMDDKNMEIRMSFIKGKKVRDVLDKNMMLCKDIGGKIALMHNAGIIHGDLTTSNMIYHEKIYFIDFGLSYFSEKVEDKAVDLHVLRQALESKHHMISDKAFSVVIDSYKSKVKDAEKILKRLEKVESRGRNKKK